jgi:hypothetical protein
MRVSLKPWLGGPTLNRVKEAESVCFKGLMLQCGMASDPGVTWLRDRLGWDLTRPGVRKAWFLFLFPLPSKTQEGRGKAVDGPQRSDPIRQCLYYSSRSSQI